MTTTIMAPLTGTLVPLEQVSDPVFAKKLLGDGIAIQPTDTAVCSPVSGKVTMIAETKHAIGLVTDTGVEILIHIGIDTVNLKGVGFESLVAAETYVESGTPLITFDLDVIKNNNLDSITMILIPNSKLLGTISKNNGEVTTGKDWLMEIADQ